LNPIFVIQQFTESSETSTDGTTHPHLTQLRFFFEGLRTGRVLLLSCKGKVRLGNRGPGSGATGMLVIWMHNVRGTKVAYLSQRKPQPEGTE